MTISLEFQRVVMLSTGHITKDDNERLHEMALADLEDGAQPFLVASYYGGFLIRVLGEPIFPETLHQRENAGLSDAFLALMKLAAEHKADWLRLDTDGLTSDELPTFEW